MIDGIIGLMNSGKTLYMAQRLLIEYLKGKTIITNIDLAFPHRKVNKDFLFWLGEEQPIIENVAFGFDELWIWLDAREHQSNTLATYFFNQSSKDDTRIYFTAQYIGQTEKRLRQNLHRISQCSRVLLIDNKFIPIDEEDRFLPKHLWDKLYIKIVVFKRVNLGYYSELIPQKPFYIKANIYFNLYNTRQKISKKGEI